MKVSISGHLFLLAELYLFHIIFTKGNKMQYKDFHLIEMNRIDF